MKSIDLVLFADYSQKLTGEMLASTVTPTEQNKTAKFLSAHFIDFVIGLCVSSAISQSFTASVNLLLQAKVMSSSFSMHHSAAFTSMTFPLVLLSYFSFFYLLNHGQTWGMYFMKSRLTVEQGNLWSALKWGCYSFSICFSGGISLLLLQTVKVKEVFQVHDYLYSELMTHRELQVINLVDETLRTPSEEVADYRIAA